ncbi:MAG: hypothetical protein AB1552_14105 [Nitrospirota bacterium]
MVEENWEQQYFAEPVARGERLLEVISRLPRLIEAERKRKFYVGIGGGMMSREEAAKRVISPIVSETLDWQRQMRQAAAQAAKFLEKEQEREAEQQEREAERKRLERVIESERISAKEMIARLKGEMPPTIHLPKEERAILEKEWAEAKKAFEEEAETLSEEKKAKAIGEMLTRLTGEYHPEATEAELQEAMIRKKTGETAQAKIDTAFHMMQIGIEPDEIERYLNAEFTREEVESLPVDQAKKVWPIVRQYRRKWEVSGEQALRRMTEEREARSAERTAKVEKVIKEAFAEPEVYARIWEAEPGIYPDVPSEIKEKVKEVARERTREVVLKEQKPVVESIRSLMKRYRLRNVTEKDMYIEVGENLKRFDRSDDVSAVLDQLVSERVISMDEGIQMAKQWAETMGYTWKE